MLVRSSRISTHGTSMYKTVHGRQSRHAVVQAKPSLFQLDFELFGITAIESGWFNLAVPDYAQHMHTTLDLQVLGRCSIQPYETRSMASCGSSCVQWPRAWFPGFSVFQPSPGQLPQLRSGADPTGCLLHSQDAQGSNVAGFIREVRIMQYSNASISIT